MHQIKCRNSWIKSGNKDLQIKFACDRQPDREVGRKIQPTDPKKGVAGQARGKYTSHSKTHTHTQIKYNRRDRIADIIGVFTV